MRSKSMLIWVGTALLGVVVGVMAACGGTGDTGGNGCIPGDQTSCDCAGGTKGVHVCGDDGKSYGMCQCGGAGGSGSGSTTSTSVSASSGQMGACGDGIEQPKECDPTSEFYCPQDCKPDGGNCAGHVYYSTMVPNIPSVWVSGGLTSFAAGDDMCVKTNMGADHVCEYQEVLAAQANGELKAIPQGTTAWVNRLTPAMVNGMPSAPGPGGRCNDWTYSTNHISDGEYITFDTVGVPTYHLDNDTVFIQNDTTHQIPGDLQCGSTMRAILCCYTKCM